MPSASAFTDQSADSLCLSLVHGHLDVTPYNVLWSKTLKINDISLTARVIGASHIITYLSDDVLFNEMLACTEPPSHVDSYRLPLKADDSHRVEWRTAQLHYVFESTRLNWINDEPEALVNLVSQASSPEEGCVGVVYTFPQGNLSAIPKTVLWGGPSQDGNGVAIQTAHSYPGQAVVLSHSSIVRTES